MYKKNQFNLLKKLYIKYYYMERKNGTYEVGIMNLSID